jgi:AraC-like DNA-binding protein
MNDLSHRARYEARLNRVLDHIHDHLDEPLDIDRLAEIACLSPYHWHRIYQAMHGETVAATVRRLPNARGIAACSRFRGRFGRCSACRQRNIASGAHIAGFGRRDQETMKW